MSQSPAKTIKLDLWPQYEDMLEVPGNLNEAKKILQRRIEFVADPQTTMVYIKSIFAIPPRHGTKEKLLEFLQLALILENDDLMILAAEERYQEFVRVVEKTGMQSSFVVVNSLDAFVWAVRSYYAKEIGTSIIPAPIVKVWERSAKRVQRILAKYKKETIEYYYNRSL